MHWSEDIAARLIARSPEKEIYTCAAGISPSGSVHIGNFRDVATSFFVASALRRLGRQARVIFSWDEFDRLRKVPSNVASVAPPDFSRYIGYPLADIPDPFSADGTSYARHFEEEFERVMPSFGIDLEYRRQAGLYRSGIYAPHVIRALEKRGEIFDILDSFRTQDAQEGEKEDYYPVSIYCPDCGRDSTRITSLTPDCTVAEYECKCGRRASFDFTREFNCKLAWKVDWPMRWMHEGVDFEPGGKDHASPNGSYQTSRVIAEKIFGFKAPVFEGYEFIGIKASNVKTSKMSSSKGENYTPETLLSVYEPRVIMWLYSKSELLKQFDFCFDSGILAHYREFDAQREAFIQGRTDELASTVMRNTLSAGPAADPVPMNLLVQLGSVVDFNPGMVKVLFDKISMEYSEADIASRLGLARNWVEMCAPEMRSTLRTCRNWEAYEALADEEKEDVSLLHGYLKSGGYTMDDLSAELYGIVKRRVDESDAKTLRKVQARFFSNVYSLLIGKDDGPRLYLFLYAIESGRYLHLLDFSTPKTTEEEEGGPAKAAGAAEAAPAKPMIGFDEFAKLDLRVCEVVSCSAIEGSSNCLELRLFDGKGSRTIVSSIAGLYSPADLQGRKIVVLVNLEPRKIAGVMSEGMLLASEGGFGCELLFPGNDVPAGTPVH